jgi:hypothetical protein
MVKLLLEYLFYLLNSVLLILIKCISRSKFTSLTLNNSMSGGLTVKWY